MAEKAPTQGPRTAGDLRRLIAKMGYNWVVDPRLRDDDALPRYPRGGKSGGTVAVVSDVASVLRRDPPVNPFLRARWVELGLLARDQLGPRSGSPTMSTPGDKKL